MRTLASLVLAGVALTACADATTAPSAEPTSTPAVNPAISAGETLVRVGITRPTSTTITLNVGQTYQMSSKMYYSRGGTLSGVPYVGWSSEDPCTATVTTASPSWGLVKGVRAGTVKILAGAWGKADTVTVIVQGSGNLDASCEDRQAAAHRDDESNGTPATSYRVAAGEKLTKLVLFKPTSSIPVGSQIKVIAEMWYNRGGKLLANPYVWFHSSNPSVATVAAGGFVAGKAAGNAKIVVHLGNMADTVPVTVVR